MVLVGWFSVLSRSVSLAVVLREILGMLSVLSRSCIDCGIQAATSIGEAHNPTQMRFVLPSLGANDLGFEDSAASLPQRAGKASLPQLQLLGRALACRIEAGRAQRAQPQEWKQRNSYEKQPA